MLSNNHESEWVEGSGVSPLITRLNVESLEDAREIDKRLERNVDRRWKHWEHGPGWWVSGVDPLTGEHTWEGGQFKPDTPVHRAENGTLQFKADGTPDLQKYFSASSYPTEPLFLDNGQAGYWASVIADNSKPVVVTEGGKKAGSGLTIDIATISIPGVSAGQKLGRLKPKLLPFCRVGRVIYLCFDSDVMTKPQVRLALDMLGKLISVMGAVVRIIALPSDTKGMDDFIVKYGASAFRALMDAAQTFEEWRKEQVVFQKNKGRLEETPAAAENLIDRVRLILNNGHSLPIETTLLENIRVVQGYSERQFSTQIVGPLREELERKDDLKEVRQRVEKLLLHAEEELNLASVLPLPLAKAFVDKAKSLSIDPVLLLQYFWPAAASQMGGKVRLILNEDDPMSPRIEKPIIWTVAVLDSSDGKTRAKNAICDPIKRRQYAESLRYKAEMEDFARESEARTKNKESPAPEKPQAQRKFMFNQVTMEALLRRLSEQNPQNGSLWVRDEIKGLFASLDQYKSNGKGDSLEILLELWDGGSIQVDRVYEEDSFFLKESCMSLCGGVQTAIAPQIFRDPHDSNGLRARFLVAVPKRVPYKATRVTCNITEMLEALYDALDSLGETDIRLTPEARARYDAWEEKLDAAMHPIPGTARKNFLGKCKTYTGRLAILIHCIQYCYGLTTEKEVLSLETLEKAISHIKFYIHQFDLLLAKNDDSGDPSGIMVRVQEFAQRNPEGVTPREVYRAVGSIKTLAQKANKSESTFTIDLFYQLSETGLGRITKEGRVLRYFAGAMNTQALRVQEQHIDDTHQVENVRGGSSDATGLVIETQAFVVEETTMPGNDYPSVSHSCDTDKTDGGSNDRHVPPLQPDLVKEEKTIAVLQVNSVVHKRHKFGWTGVVQRIEADDAYVLWNGDSSPTRIPLSELRLDQ